MYTALDFTDAGVALNQSFIPGRDRNLEERYYDRMWVHIDGERVKEGVNGHGLDVVFTTVKRHITELQVVSEVDTRDSPGAGA